MDRNLRIENMGVVSYGPMLALQEQRHLDIQQGKSDDTLFLLEHWPVVTSGRNGKTESLLASESELKRRGVQFYCTGRGGDVTYHAPGQVVGYPIVELQESERDIKSYVW